MLNKDLFLTHNLITFENLTELLDCLDEYLTLYNFAILGYSERLGILIREQKTAASNPTAQQQTESRKDGTHQKRSGGRENKEPWFVFRPEKDSVVAFRIANIQIQSPSTAESTVLFRVVESLKEKVRQLDVVKKAISELPSKGVRSNQRFLVSFSDGLPRQIVPTNQSYDVENKFSYSGEFEMQTMTESDALSAASTK